LPQAGRQGFITDMHQQLYELRSLAADAENRKTETGIPRVFMVRGEVPEHALATVYEPMINLILAGRKAMMVGNRTLRYDPATYFVMTVDLPAIGTVSSGQNGEPYLAISLTLNPEVVDGLLSDVPVPSSASVPRAFEVAPVTPDLLDAWVRLFRLRQKPDEIAALAPAYEREILFRVLQGPHGALLRDVATPTTMLARVNQTIRWVRDHYDQPLRVDALAAMAAISTSAFHRHFKEVTTLSPLQFQKKMRLLHARRLLANGGHNATAAAFAVGYESVTQFSREYARLFGASPARDAARIIGELRNSKEGCR